MSKKKTAVFLIVVAAVIAALVVGIVLTDGLYEKAGSVNETMQDAVLHEGDKISFFGLAVNPAVLSAFVVTGILLVFAVIVRIFVIPKFSYIPGKFQLLLEQAVGMFENLAKTNSPHRNNFLGAYLFAAGAYISIGTLFELVGIPWMTAAGASVSLARAPFRHQRRDHDGVSFLSRHPLGRYPFQRIPRRGADAERIFPAHSP